MAGNVTNDSLTPDIEAGPARSPRRAKRGLRWVPLAVAAVVVGGVVVAASSARIFGGAEARKVLTHKVSRANLTITVVEDGNVESASNVDIKCAVAGGGTILTIVPDGTEVKAGDVLITLDTAAIEEAISAQKIIVEKAQATKIQAEKDFAAAEIAVQEYVDGVFLQTLQTLRSTATIAKENLNSAENTLEYAEKMLRKGYITELQRDAEIFAVEKAKLDLETADLAIEVLEKYTKAKTVEQLESVRDSAKARKESETTAFDLEVARLKRLEAQMANCVIRAPQDGMVVYANEAANSRFSRSDAPRVEEGAMVRERQNLIKLPDLSQMQVKCTVHETKVEQLSIGMRARIKIQDRELLGSVMSIANQPEPNSMFGANIKEYATVVRIDGESEGLKPGMTAQVEIFAADLKSVIAVPVQVIVELRGKFYAWVNTPNGPERRLLVLGMSNNILVEVKDGLSEGDEVIMNPRAIVEEARDDESDLAAGTEEGQGPPGEAAGDAGEAGGGPGGPGGPGGGMGGPGGGGPGGGQGGGGPGAGGPGGGARPAGGFSLSTIDSDGAGKISMDEAPEMMKQNFDVLDKNADGFIDTAEFASRPKGKTGGRPPGGGEPGGGGFGGPGGGGPGGGFGGPGGGFGPGE